MTTRTAPSLASLYRFDGVNYGRWILGWTLIGLPAVRMEFADATRFGGDPRTWEPWVWAFSGVYSLAMISPVVVFLCYRWPFEPGRRLSSAWKHLLSYVPFSLGFIGLMMLLRCGAYLLVEGHLYDIGDPWIRLAYEFPKPLLAYALIAFVAYTIIAQQRAREEQLEAARLRERLLGAQLDRLTGQIRPHFLFNTLNVISGTMYEDVERADSMIARLSDLLRGSLATTQKPFQTVREEMETVRSFLEIARLRFGDRLRVEYDVARPAESLMLPSMILQPIVENAVKHGIEPSANDGTVEIRVSESNGRLVIEIANSGSEARSNSPSTGIGLDNCRERLRHLYPDQHELSLTLLEDGGALVRLSIPAERMARNPADG